jgi:hypothetical protein
MVVNEIGAKCRKCGEDKCSNREFLSAEGYCYPCDNYLVPDPTRKECIAPTCPSNQVITTDGKCEACPRG